MKKIKNSAKLWLSKLISAGMAFCMIVAAGIPALNAHAAEIQQLSDTAVASDILHTQKVDLSDLLSAMDDVSVSTAERQWLDEEGAEVLPSSLSLTYDSAVPHTLVTVSFLPEGKAEILAKTYTGEVAKTVWTPSTVTVDGKKYFLSSMGNGEYQAVISVTDTELSLSVQYDTALTLSVRDANLLRKAAYRRAEELYAALAAYDQAVKEHSDATEAYNAYRAEYQKYSLAMKEYNAYQQALKAYETRQEAYQAYLKELEAYEAEYARYEAYLSEKKAYDKALAEYTDFVNNPVAYEKKYMDYCAYLAKLEKTTAQLALADSCFASDEAGHVLVNTLNGPTVKTVVARQNELVSAGCDAQDIANADQSTKRLIAILAEYPLRKDDSERYAYYVKYYAEIRDNVTLLYTSLSNLYGNDGVADLLELEGKKERYWQFVAQLYALSCAMDDAVALNMQWNIAGKTLTALLDSCFILKDTNTATPLTAYPAYMEEVIPPGQMKKPTPPAVVEKPVAPLKVAEPQAPAVVSKPVLPSIVPAPGPYPSRPLFSTTEEALAEAYGAQQLTNRSDIAKDVVYPLTILVEKTVRSDDIPVAYFYGHDRMTLLAVQSANDLGWMSWPEDPTPPKGSDGLVYSFIGWMDEDGRVYTPDEVGLSLTESKCFYAAYTSTKMSYTVTWDIEGKLTQESYEHGELPTYQGTPAKADDQENVYTFVGWTPVVRPVTQNVTYTAVFSAQKRFFEVQWVIGDSTESETYAPGELPSYLSVPTLPMDGRYVYTFSHWSPEITTVNGNAVYTAVFEAVDLLGGDDQAVLTETENLICVTKPEKAGELHLSIRHLLAYASERSCGLKLTQGNIDLALSEDVVHALNSAQAEELRLYKRQGTASLGLHFYDAKHQELAVNAQAQVTIGLPTRQSGSISGASGEVISSVRDGVLSADITAGEAYTFKIGYAVTVHMTVDGNTDETGGIYTLSNTLPTVGETVVLTVKTSPGYDVKAVVVRDRFGAVISHAAHANGQYSFSMPEGSVDVTVQMIPHRYTATFCMGDVIISREQYYYGDMPVIPADPTRASDQKYSYTFVGWTPTVTAVMGDIVYEAEFMAVSLEEQASVDASKLGILQLALIGVASAAVVYTGILVPYEMVRRSRKKTSANRGSAQRKG